jgi:hypothetical protein
MVIEQLHALSITLALTTGTKICYSSCDGQVTLQDLFARFVQPPSPLLNSAAVAVFPVVVDSAGCFRFEFED